MIAAPGEKSGCHAREDSPYVEGVAPFTEFVSGLKADPRMVMVAAIVGDPTTVATELRSLPAVGSVVALSSSCVSDSGVSTTVADPSVRIAEFARSFPGRSRVESVCDEDLTLALGAVGATAKKMMGDSCIDATLVDVDVDATTPGLQPLCEVTEGADEHAVPACQTGSEPTCWQITADAEGCPTSPDNVRIGLRRSVAPTSQFFTTARCLTAP